MTIKKLYKKLLIINKKINTYIRKKKRKNALYWFEVFVYITGSSVIIMFVLRLMGWFS